MRCGAKCFLVETINDDGKKETISVNARNSVGARKVIRGEYGDRVEIVSVTEEKRK